MGRKSKIEKRILARDPSLPFANVPRKLSPKEAGIHRSIGKQRAKERKPPKPRPSYETSKGEKRYLVIAQRNSKNWKKGQIKDNQSASRAASIDRHGSRRGTKSDRR